jgi:hypothetical protein
MLRRLRPVSNPTNSFTYRSSGGGGNRAQGCRCGGLAGLAEEKRPSPARRSTPRPKRRRPLRGCHVRPVGHLGSAGEMRAVAHRHHAPGQLRVLGERGAQCDGQGVGVPLQRAGGVWRHLRCRPLARHFLAGALPSASSVVGMLLMTQMACGRSMVRVRLSSDTNRTTLSVKSKPRPARRSTCRECSAVHCGNDVAPSRTASPAGYPNGDHP